MYKVRDEDGPITEIDECKHVSFAKEPIIFKSGCENPQTFLTNSHLFEPEPCLKPKKQIKVQRHQKSQYIFLFLCVLLFLLFERMFENMTSQDSDNAHHSNNSIGSILFDFLLRLRDLR